MCYINANNSQYFCISMGLSSGDFKVPITGRHYCSITLTLIVPHWGAGSLSSLLPGLTEAGTERVARERVARGLGQGRAAAIRWRDPSLHPAGSQVKSRQRAQFTHTQKRTLKTNQFLPRCSLCFPCEVFTEQSTHRALRKCSLIDRAVGGGVCHKWLALVALETA